MSLFFFFSICEIYSTLSLEAALEGASIAG